MVPPARGGAAGTGRTEARNAAVEEDVAEVHRLLHDGVPAAQHAAPPPGGRLAGVLQMLSSKAARHEAAWRRYLALRQAAEQRHAAAAATAAAQLGAALEAAGAETEREMAALADEASVMELDTEQIDQVWQRAARRRAAAAASIDALGGHLRAAERELREAADGALRAAVAELSEVAHTDEGTVQRLVEQEAAGLNLLVLGNRKAAAAVLEELHAREVQLEAARRARWEAALAAWRALRSRHALQCFCRRVREELREPAARLKCFAQLRAAQRAAHRRLAQLLEGVARLQPPHLSAAAVADWTQRAQQWTCEWQQQLADCLHHLRKQEDELEEQARAGLSALRQELHSYAGFSAEELVRMLQSEAEPALAARRADAEQLMQCAAAYLERQAAEWQLAAQAMGSWLTSLASLWEGHRAQVAASEADGVARLRTGRAAAEQQAAEAEQALAAAVLSISQGSSEQALDQRVDDALRVLSGIEAGYRAWRAAAAEAARRRPAEVKQQGELYQRCLAGLLHVQPAPAQAQTDEQQQQQQQQGSLLEVKPGAFFVPLHDLWTALLDAMPNPWLQQPLQDQPQAPAAPPPPSQQQQQQRQQPRQHAGNSRAAAAPAPPAARPAASERRQSISKQHVAAESAAAAAAAAAAAETAAAAAAAAEAAQPPPCPVAVGGATLCEQLDVPSAPAQASLRRVQAAALLDMEAFSASSQCAAEEWCEHVEAQLDEELDGRLRAHRPRAGHIEEEVRAARSVELLGQRRRVEGFVHTQLAGVARQQADFEAAGAELHRQATGWRDATSKCEALLGATLSLRGIDACWREAQALAAKQQAQLTERVAELRRRAADGRAAVAAASRRFEAQQLRTFEQGGAYAEDSVHAHKAAIACCIDGRLDTQAQKQEQQVDALQQELAAGLDAARAGLEHVLPSYRQDMALVEALGRCVDGAKKLVASALQRSSQEENAIKLTLQRLQAALAAQPSAAAQPAAGRCQELLEAADQLRLQLLQRAQGLELLQSPAGLAATPVTLAVPSELRPLALPDGLGESSAQLPPTCDAAGAAAVHAGAAAAAPATRPNGGQKAAATVGGKAAPLPAKRGQAEGPPQVAAAPPIARDLHSAIETARKEAEAAVQAFFAAKDPGRPLRYPTKLAASSKEQMAVLDASLSELTQTLQQHTAAAATQLRAQAARAAELLEALPPAALQLLGIHLATAASQQQSELQGVFAGRRCALEQQLQEHKGGLRPGMIHPARRGELEALKAAEASRQQAALDLLSAYAAARLSLVGSQASQFAEMLAAACRQLLALLDGCVIPQDLLPPPAEGAAAAAAVHDAPQPASLGRARGKAHEQERPPPASSKQGSPAPLEAAAAARPFASASWQLPAEGLRLRDLGWGPEDQAALAGLAAAAGPPAAAGAQAGAPPAAATSSGRPCTAAAAAAAAGQPHASSAEPATVVGLDAPSQRAVVHAHSAAVQHCREAALVPAVADLKAQLRHWRDGEQRWAAAWATMVADLDPG